MADNPEHQKGDNTVLEAVSLGSKEFYSAGATFSTFACAAVVVFGWGALADIYSPFKSRMCALVLSFMIVFAYALVIPEPRGFPSEGMFRVTISEWVFGFLNALIVFSTAVALAAAIH